MGTELAGSATADLSSDIFTLGASLRRARDLTVDQAWALLKLYAANGTLPGVTVPGKPTRKATINASVINRVTFVKVNGLEVSGKQLTGRITDRKVEPIGWAALDLRLVVFIHRLAGRLQRMFGVQRIYHLGFSSKHNDSHGDGRAVDFVGVDGQLDGYAFHINVLSHWNLQPVEMPVAFGAHKAGDRVDNWPKDFRGTVYRLDPSRNRYLDPGILRKNLGSKEPEFELTTAFRLFQDIYEFAAKEAHDGGSDLGPATTIGASSNAIMHPDHSDTKQRADHFQHMHIEIGTRHDPRVATR